LYHGTSSKFITDILRDGLKSMNRQYVHLSDKISTAKQVGERHGGNLIVLEINVEKMIKDNIKFFISDNGVFLVDKVNPKYLQIINL